MRALVTPVGIVSEIELKKCMHGPKFVDVVDEACGINGTIGTDIIYLTPSQCKFG
jgi:hypothetical protein